MYKYILALTAIICCGCAVSAQPGVHVSEVEGAPSVAYHPEQEPTRSAYDLQQAPTQPSYESDEAFALPEELNIEHTPEQFDSLIANWHSQNVVNSYDDFFKEFIMLDSTATYESNIPDSVYMARLRMIISPIHLGYNDVVRRYIVAYTEPRKQLMGRIIGLSHAYFPMIEEELVNAGLPIELRALPIIESAMDPTAVSRAGATGIWQFMYNTGKHYGLEITSLVDERRDPVAATRAACKYLKDMYALYNDWTLAIASYNCGPGNVNKALKRAGEGAKTFWDIYPYLPKETRGYVPSFIAATYAYTFHSQHGIVPRESSIPVATDTINIAKLTHFEQISSTLGTSVETLRALNPKYKLDIVPAVEGKTYSIVMPQSDVARYIAQEEQIMAKDSVYLAQYLNRNATIKATDLASAGSTVHRVKSGDTLSGIASKYGVKVSQLTKWNNLKTTSVLRIGQRIEIWR